MNELSNLQKRWVQAFVANGFNATAAARAAGYGEDKKTGWRLKNSPAIQAAVIEECQALGVNWLPMVMRSMIDIAKDRAHKDHVRVCLWLLQCAGLGPQAPRRESKTEAEHRFDGNAVEELRRLQRELGLARGREPGW